MRDVVIMCALSSSTCNIDNIFLWKIFSTIFSYVLEIKVFRGIVRPEIELGKKDREIYLCVNI